MAAVTSLMVLACAWAAGVAYPHGAPEECGLIQTGSAIGAGIILAPTALAPGTADWEIIIPDIPNCPNGPVGVTAIVCDDVKPEARFITNSIISVQRVGNLNGVGSVTPTVYCGNDLHNNQPWLQNKWLSNNQQTSNQPLLQIKWLSNNQQPLLQNKWLSSTQQPLLQNKWLSNNKQQNDVTLYSHLYGQSSLPSLSVTPLSQLYHTHNPLLSQSQLSRRREQSSLPSLSVIPLSQLDRTQYLLGQSQNSVWGQSPQPVYGQSSLPSLSVTPLSQLDQTHNPLLCQSQLSGVCGQSPHLLLKQSSLPSLSVTRLSQLDHTHDLLGQSQNSVWGQSPQPVYGQSSLPSLSATPLSQLDHTHNPLLCQSQLSGVCGQSPHLLLGPSSLPQLGQSVPKSVIINAYKKP